MRTRSLVATLCAIIHSIIIVLDIVTMCSEHCDSLRRIEFSLLAKPGPFVLHRSLEPLLTTSSLALVGGYVSSVLFTILIPSSLFPTHDPAPRISCSSSWTCLQSTQLSFSFVSAVLSPPSLHSRHTVLSGFLALICRPRPRYSGGPPSYAIILLLFNTNTFGPCRPSSSSPRV